MKKRFLLHVPAGAVLMTLAAVASAQPVLTAENSIDPLIGSEVTLTQFIATAPNDLLPQLASGEDVTWDLTTADYGEPEVASLQYHEPPFAGLPGADRPEFEDANFVQELLGTISEDIAEQVVLYNYSILTDEGILRLGFAGVADADEDGDPDTVSVIVNPAELELPFPATFGDSWQSTGTQIFAVGGTTFTGGTVNRTAEVVGWGTLVTPEGSAQALMISETFVLSFLGTPTQATESFEFLAPLESTGKNPAVRTLAASFTMSPDGASIAEASYTVIESGGAPTAAEEQTDLPSRIALGQNYPNPFNPGTVIPFSVERSGRVTLTVHDVLGRRIETLVDRRMASGTYEVGFDATGLPSGIYRVTLRSGGAVQTGLITFQK